MSQNQTDTLPTLAILHGSREPMFQEGDPVFPHQIFESTIKAIEARARNEEYKTCHGITLLDEDPVMIVGDDRIPLTEINAKANQLARYIQKNYQPRINCDGDLPVAVNIPPGPELVTTLMAIWKLGATQVPLEETMPNTRVRFMLEETQPVVVIVDCEDEERYRGFCVMTYNEIRDLSQFLSTENLETDWSDRALSLDHTSFLMYTSGSTGRPKGARVPHRAILNRLKWQWRTMPFTPTEKVAVYKCVISFFDAIQELWGSMFWGRSILVLTRPSIIDIEVFIQNLDKYEIERLVILPSFLYNILMYYYKDESSIHNATAVKPLASVKYWMCTSEVLSTHLVEKFYKIFDPKDHILFNSYGTIEIGGDASIHKVTLEDLKGPSIPLGVPIDNATFYVLDRRMLPVNVGERGELYSSGPSLYLGYAAGRHPEKMLHNHLSSESGHSVLYGTGDHVRIVNGVVYYEGRIDSQVKVRGHTVNITEIEQAILNIDYINKSAVLAYKRGQVQQELLAYVTSTKSDVTISDIEERMKKRIPSYMIPQIFILPKMPLHEGGKIDRPALLKMYDERYQKVTHEFDYKEVPNSLKSKAKVLFEAVAETLGHSLRKGVNALSNYFDLGGNSLNTVLILAKLRDFGYSISFGDFLSADSLLQVIKNMKEDQSTDEKANLEAQKEIAEGKYSAEIMQDSHKEAVISIISDSFYEKGELEKSISASLKKEDYREIIENIWGTLMDQKISYVVKNQKGEVVAASICFDGNNIPVIHVESNWTIIQEFLESIEKPHRGTLLSKLNGKVLHTFMGGTASSVLPQENIEIMIFMEENNSKIAKDHGYAAIFTTNSNPLTQQLATDVFGYKVLEDHQINKYVTPDGTKPFGSAPNFHRAVVCWKEL